MFSHLLNVLYLLGDYNGNIHILPRDVIRRLCNKDRDQGSKGIWGLGIDRMVRYSTLENYVLRLLTQIWGKHGVNNLFTVFSRP